MERYSPPTTPRTTPPSRTRAETETASPERRPAPPQRTGLRSSISTHFQRLGIELNTTFNKGGQYEQAHRQLMAWGHDAREATAIAKTADYPRLHALVFGTLIGPPPFAPRTPTLNESDTQALLAVCQAWLEAGNPMAASRLVCAVFKDRPLDAALLHQLLCRAPKAPQTLMTGFEPDATQHLVPAILCLAERGWTNRADPSVHLNAASRDALDKLVQRADPTQWMRLCLITARQRVQAGQPLGERQARKHLQRMEDLLQRPDLEAEWHDAAVDCALGLAALCPSLRDRARQLQADHEAQRLRQLTQRMADWLQLDIAVPTDLVTPHGLTAVNVNPETLAQLEPSALDSARHTFRDWLMRQAQSPQGLPCEQLNMVVRAVAGAPPSRDWVPVGFELQLTLTLVHRDLARGVDATHHLLHFLEADPTGFRLDAPQLARTLATIQHPGVDPLARYALLSHLLSWLPPLATAPLQHKAWLSTVLSRSTELPEDLRYTLIDERHRTREPAGIDEPRTRQLHDDQNRCHQATAGAGDASPLRAALFDWCVERTQAPATNADWTVWRAVASAWLRDIANLQGPADENRLVPLIQTLAQPDPSRPHDWVPRLAELLSDTVEHLPPERRLNWLQALDAQATQMLNAQWPAETAFPVALAALCGAVRALIDAHSDPAPPPLDGVFTTPSRDDNPRLIELFRRCASAALAYHAGDAAKAATLARRTHSTMHLSAHTQRPLPPGLYDVFKAVGQRYRQPTDPSETRRRFDALKL